jgi:hypothetical protein
MSAAAGDESFEDRYREPAKRWLKVSADVAGEGLWDFDGPLPADELPLDPALIARIGAWQQAFESVFDFEYRRNDEEVLAFTDEGFAIARALVAALPSWTITYFDEAVWLANGRGRSKTPPTWTVSDDTPTEAELAQARDSWFRSDWRNWVMLRPDATGGALWSGRVRPSPAPISEALRRRIGDWMKNYMRFVRRWVPPDAKEALPLADEGLALARAIKDELPDWSVAYEDAAARQASDAARDDRIYRYLIEPAFSTDARIAQFRMDKFAKSEDSSRSHWFSGAYRMGGVMTFRPFGVD